MLSLAVEPLEARTFLSAAAASPDASTPFTISVIEQNTLNPPLEKTLIDVDGDGRVDAVVGFGSNGGMFWYKNPVSGNTWNRYVIIQNGECFEDSLPYDMNGDGAIDVVCGFNDGVSWFENPRGHGADPRTTLWTQHRIGEGDGHDIDMADLDGDGKVDVTSITSIYFQNTTDNWTTVTGTNYPRSGEGAAVLNSGHGKIDLVGTGMVNGVRCPAWFENPRDHGGNARTDLWIPRQIGTLIDPNYTRGGLEYETFDMNHDGRLDIVACQNEAEAIEVNIGVGVLWYEQPADPLSGTWVKHVIDSALTDVHRVRFADANGDGRMDIFYAETDQSPSDRVGILYDVNGDGLTWTNQVLSNHGGVNVAVADIDGDGDPDMVTSRHGIYGATHPIEVYTNIRTTQQQNVAPAITTQPKPQSVAAGTAVTFTVVATGNPAPTYRWQRNNVDIPGATNSSYTLSNPTIADSGAIFHVIVSNALGVVPSSDAILTVTTPPPPPASVYLSDMTPFLATNGWGPYERDKSNGESAASDGVAMKIGSTTYLKGLGVHAASELRYTLAKKYSALAAFVGVDAEVGTGGSVRFLAYGDGVQIFDSGVMRGGQAAQTVSVPVAGVNELRLVMNDSGDGNTNDHGDWADAKVLKVPVKIDRKGGNGTTTTAGGSSGVFARAPRNGERATDASHEGVVRIMPDDSVYRSVFFGGDRKEGEPLLIV